MKRREAKRSEEKRRKSGRGFKDFPEESVYPSVILSVCVPDRQCRLFFYLVDSSPFVVSDQFPFPSTPPPLLTYFFSVTHNFLSLKGHRHIFFILIFVCSIYLGCCLYFLSKKMFFFKCLFPVSLYLQL
jgi:hypothetical protein